MIFQRRLLTAAGITVLLLGLTGSLVAAAQDDVSTFRGELHPVNPDLTADKGPVSGDVTFTIDGDELTIEVHAEGVPPDMGHWQHIHGLVGTDQEAACPDAAADANGDGYVDLIETGPMAGTTMIPLNDDPVSMKIPTSTYPAADAEGTYTYTVTVSLDELQTAFTEAFPEETKLDLASRVVFIHGVPETTGLPDSVASLGEIPAQVTIPIACAQIDPVTPGATPVATPDASPAA